MQLTGQHVCDAELTGVRQGYARCQAAAGERRSTNQQCYSWSSGVCSSRMAALSSGSSVGVHG
jgi:hypothetical protein